MHKCVWLLVIFQYNATAYVAVLVADSSTEEPPPQRTAAVSPPDGDLPGSGGPALHSIRPRSYSQRPGCIFALRVHAISFTSDNEI